MKAKYVLAAGAVLAAIIGTSMIAAPAQFLAPLGLAVDDKIALLAQAQGSLLLGLATINWMARCAEGTGLRAVLVGNIVAQLAAIAVNARGLATGLVPAAGWGQVAMHLLLAAAYGLALSTAHKPPDR